MTAFHSTGRQDGKQTSRAVALGQRELMPGAQGVREHLHIPKAAASPGGGEGTQWLAGIRGFIASQRCLMVTSFVQI